MAKTRFSNFIIKIVYCKKHTYFDFKFIFGSFLKKAVECLAYIGRHTLIIIQAAIFYWQTNMHAVGSTKTTIWYESRILRLDNFPDIFLNDNELIGTKAQAAIQTTIRFFSKSCSTNVISFLVKSFAKARAFYINSNL